VHDPACPRSWANPQVAERRAAVEGGGGRAGDGSATASSDNGGGGAKLGVKVLRGGIASHRRLGATTNRR
jgi:hypothetical protein